MVRVGVVGLGKMGISHLSLLNAHPDVSVTGVCDSAGYILDVLAKYTGLSGFGDVDSLLDAGVDALVIATPTRTHADLVRRAMDRGVHVFCEKPFTLDPADSLELARLADDKGLVTQVGYHNRFVATFGEMKRLLEQGAIGEVTHVLAEAYGPVVLRPQGGTWRSNRSEGGGCLYDYAAHPIDLMCWYFGRPSAVGGTVLSNVFSRDTEDEVYASLRFPNGASGQLSVNWSDESQRKMTTKLTIWGTNGRLYADRTECRAYLREVPPGLPGYEKGWNIRYTTELTDPVWFYLRGEEYSAQIDHFVRRVAGTESSATNSFLSAAATDETIDMLIVNAQRGLAVSEHGQPTGAVTRRRTPGAWWRRLLAPKSGAQGPRARRSG